MTTFTPNLCFVAHAKGEQDAPVTRAAVDAFRAHYPDLPLAYAGEEWARHGATAGGFIGWPDFVAGLRVDGSPRYIVLIVPSPVVGKATADLVRRFLDNNRPVLVAQPQDGPALPRLCWALAVEETTGDYRNGWVVVPGEPV